MKPLKIYFLSSEIYPFSNTYSLSKFSNQFNSYIHENKEVDIRLCQPKYGYISERKYILREVIRLKDLKINFLNKDHNINLKSAFIPETRVQVYFMEHNDYFKPIPDLLYKSRNGRVFQNNHEKFLFFVYTTFETLKKLFWVPDIIICNDWQMAILGQLIKEKFKDDKLYSKIKTVSFVHSYNSFYKYPNNLLKKLDLTYDNKKKEQDAFNIMSEFSDLNYIFDDGKLLKSLSKKSQHKEYLSIKKNKIIEDYHSKNSSEKVEIFNQIMEDFKSIV